MLGKTKAWFGPNKIELTKDTVYTHPTSKQCNYNVDTSNLVTKDELEKVKGMIDVSARIVGSGQYSKLFTTDTSKTTTTGSVNIQLPTCDYIELESALVKIPYSTAVTSSNAQLSYDIMYMPLPKIILVAGGQESVSTCRHFVRGSGSSNDVYELYPIAVSLNAVCTLTSAEFFYNRDSRYYFDWYYTCYKYDS